MRNKVGLTISLTFLYFSFLMLVGTAFADAQGKKAPLVLAKGDGIEVTLMDMERMRTHFESRRIHLKPEKYRVAALEMKLYAAEAKYLGLDKEIEGLSEMDPFEKEGLLASKYLQNVWQEYPIDETIILSYYRANPKKFEEWDEQSQSYKPPQFDKGIKEKVRKIVITPKKQEIQQNTYQVLVEKYNVELCELEKGCGVEP